MLGKYWLSIDTASQCTEYRICSDYLLPHSAKNVDVDEVIQRVYSSQGGGLLPEPIPLSQMIDILIDFWEADGLFD